MTKFAKQLIEMDKEKKMREIRDKFRNLND